MGLTLEIAVSIIVASFYAVASIRQREIGYGHAADYDAVDSILGCDGCCVSMGAEHKNTHIIALRSR